MQPVLASLPLQEAEHTNPLHDERCNAPSPCGHDARHPSDDSLPVRTGRCPW